MTVNEYQSKISAIETLIQHLILDKDTLVQQFQEHCPHEHITSKCVVHEGDFGRWVDGSRREFYHTCDDCGASAYVFGDNNTVEYIVERINFEINGKKIL